MRSFLFNAFCLFFAIIITDRLIAVIPTGADAFTIVLNTAIVLLIALAVSFFFRAASKSKNLKLQSVVFVATFMAALVHTFITFNNFYSLIEPNLSNKLVVLLCMFGVGLYGGLVGYGSISRVGIIACVAFFIFIAAVLLTNIGDVRLSDIGQAVELQLFDSMLLSGLAALLPLIPAMYLFCADDLKPSKVTLIYLCCFAFIALYLLVSRGVLGENMLRFVVPTHTLAVIGKYSVTREFDALFNLLLLFIGMLKMSIYCAGISKFCKKKLYVLLIAAAAVIAFIVSEVDIVSIGAVVVSVAIAAMILTIDFKGKKAVALFAALMLLTSCTGMELRERASVTLTFIDKSEAGYTVGMLVNTSYQQTKAETDFIVSQGESLTQALYGATSEVKGELFFGHSGLLLLGKELSNENFSSLLPQVAKTEILSQDGIIFLTEYSIEEMSEKQVQLQDYVAALTQQSADNRIFKKIFYSIDLDDTGNINDIIPGMKLFESQGVTTDYGYIYSGGNYNMRLEHLQLDTYLALNGQRERLAVEYVYNDKAEITQISGLSAQYSLSGSKLNVTVDAELDKTFSKDEAQAIKTAFTETVHDTVLSVIKSGNDLLGLLGESTLALHQIEDIEVDIAMPNYSA